MQLVSQPLHQRWLPDKSRTTATIAATIRTHQVRTPTTEVLPQQEVHHSQQVHPLQAEVLSLAEDRSQEDLLAVHLQVEAVAVAAVEDAKDSNILTQ